MSVVGRDKKSEVKSKKKERINMKTDGQCDRRNKQPLFGRCILGATIDLLPKGHVIVCTCVFLSLERDTRHPMEHKI